jgi:hypothetical protein
VGGAYPGGDGADSDQVALRFPTPRPGDPLRQDGRPAAPSYSPILPFLGVLLRGRDAPLLARASEAPSYHPSVGYARDIYVAIAMNALVDLLGFAFLFHAYVAGRAEGWRAWAIGVGLGAVFSLAFATFAVSLVRKPLRYPRLDPRGAGIAAAVVAVGVAVAALGDASLPMRRAGGLAVALGLGFGSVSALGLQDGALLATRAAVMVGVGWLVAGPLHEAMFHDEIDRSYRATAIAAIERRVSEQQALLSTVRTDRFEICMREGQQPPDPGCAEPRAEAERAELTVQALAFVRGQELTGADAERNRAFLLERAEALGSSAVVALLGVGATGRAGHGPRYQEAVRLGPVAARQAEADRDAEAACLATAAACEARLVDDPRVIALEAELSGLRDRVAVLRSGVAQPGPIERALALEALIEAPGNLVGGPHPGDPPGGDHGGGRAATIRGKLFAAWFLAMVMPVLVLVMKVSAADKLEPYLKRRWAGR